VHSLFDDEDRDFMVVRNHEEQYSIWPADREPPAGWESVGVDGLKKQCLAWIEEHWTDMRPKSLRERLGQR
jgi:MbtH protein